MGREFPALDIRIRDEAASDLVLAILDDFQPTGLEEHGGSLRAFFSNHDARDRASAALGSHFEAIPLAVSDENWAERSQGSLVAVTVGRVTVAPPSRGERVFERRSESERGWRGPQRAFSSAMGCRWGPASINKSGRGADRPITIIVRPSMGFGTGHHATTRLCLAALQSIDVKGATVLDAGTGSGVLAIAADRLGASSVIGIDSDPDAIQSARETATLNPDARHTRFEMCDLATTPLPTADLITANLTGALLERSAATLLDALTPDGRLIISGIQVEERDFVLRAFDGVLVVWEREEDGWLGVVLARPR